MILEVNKYVPVLNKKSSICIPILDDGQVYWNEELVAFTNDLKETLASIGDGVALASNQVWNEDMPLELPAVFALKLGDHIIECINPIVHGSGKSIKSEEGCLSFPGRTKLKRRHKNATLIFSTLEAPDQQAALKLTGISSRAVQHEMDHLNGKTLFPLPTNE